MKKRVTLFLVITAVTVLFLVGCGESQETMGSAEGTETVTDEASNEEVPSEDKPASAEDIKSADNEISGEEEMPIEVSPAPTNYESIIFDAKQLREQSLARNMETLLEIINNENLTDTQKQEAMDAIAEMTAIMEKEAAAEMLLEEKGYKDVVVSINGDAVDVVVNAVELTDEQRAQIEDIVKRKTEVSTENIIISTVVQ